MDATGRGCVVDVCLGCDLEYQDLCILEGWDRWSLERVCIFHISIIPSMTYVVPKIDIGFEDNRGGRMVFFGPYMS